MHGNAVLHTGGLVLCSVAFSTTQFLSARKAYGTVKNLVLFNVIAFNAEQLPHAAKNRRLRFGNSHGTIRRSVSNRAA